MSAVLGLMVLAACNEVKHYETLSFFFDGVPLPPGMRPPPGSPEELAQRRADERAERTPPPPTFYHTPYANRSCFGCHSRETGFSISRTDPNLCRSCHSDYLRPAQDDWVHGPTAQKMCGYCHEPHKSLYPGILTKPQTELCFTCHDGERLRNDPFHAARIDEQTCSSCHDPHAAGNRLLLADGRTYARRFRQVSEIKTTAHNDWAKDSCVNCHDLNKGNRLRGNLEAQCITCHDTIQSPPPQGKLHQAVTDGKCLSCHTAHRSTRPKLLRTTAQDMCTSCHKLEALPSVPHRSMVRVDCLICHQGHHSEFPSLLKPDLLSYVKSDDAVINKPDPPTDAEDEP